MEFYQDIDQVLVDKENAVNYLKMLQFQDKEIMVLEDPSYQEIKMVVRDIAIRAARAKLEGRRILTFCYYGGHGTQDNYVRSVLNSNSGHCFYNLEEQLRILAKGPSVYVVGLFDCCRERSISTDSSPRADSDETETRGTLGYIERMVEKDENLIFAFGCPPSRMTAVQSTLVKDFFEFLLKDADQTGFISLPGNLNFFRTEDRTNETLIKVT